MEMAMRLGDVVGFVQVNLFDGGFHVEVFIKDDRIEGGAITHLGAGVAAKRWFSFWYSVHPFGAR
uniref:Uncharacterized protein n=1 Tax=Romanomermis culicivorax TaxID=13658 RepID=A0A915IHW8_ROMCU